MALFAVDVTVNTSGVRLDAGTVGSRIWRGVVTNGGGVTVFVGPNAAMVYPLAPLTSLTVELGPADDALYGKASTGTCVVHTIATNS